MTRLVGRAALVEAVRAQLDTGRAVATPPAMLDDATTESPITISGCSGNASAPSTIAVNIVHTYRDDVALDLVAPDGSVYALKASSSSTAPTTSSRRTRRTCPRRSRTARGSCGTRRLHR